MPAHGAQAWNIRTNLYTQKHNTAVSPQLCGENRSAPDLLRNCCVCWQSKHIDFVRKYGVHTQNHTVYPIAVSAPAGCEWQACCCAGCQLPWGIPPSDWLWLLWQSPVLSHYWLTPEVKKYRGFSPPNVSIMLHDDVNAASTGGWKCSK